MKAYLEIEMPKNCNGCPLHFYEGQGICSCCVLPTIEDDEILKPWKNRRKDCPLVSVPKHGDLIDAGKLVELCDIMANKCDGIGVSIWHQFKTTVEWSPIVIKAEKDET